MKDLEKYYASNDDVHSETSDCEMGCNAIYLASEADAAFYEMRREHAEVISAMRDSHDFTMGKLKESCQQIETLKREHADGMTRMMRRIKELTVQAERYEKLRRLCLTEFRHLYMRSRALTFDEFVDQLPASGEASVDEQARRTE